jgi:hypothetical protein
MLKAKFNELAFNVLSLMDVKEIWAPNKIHAQEELGSAQIFDLEFGFHLALENQGILADHNQVVNVSKDPCSRRGRFVCSIKDTRVGKRCFKTGGREKRVQALVPG